jgi:hypothetical protein
VARYQAKLEVDDGKVWLTSMSKTNPTYLNYEPMESGKAVCLLHGYTFGIGGRYFRVDYRECERLGSEWRGPGRGRLGLGIQDCAALRGRRRYGVDGGAGLL